MIKLLILTICIVASVSLSTQAYATITTEHLNIPSMANVTDSYGNAFGSDGYFYVAYNENFIQKINPNNTTDNTQLIVTSIAQSIEDITFDSKDTMWISDFLYNTLQGFNKVNGTWNFSTPDKVIELSTPPLGLHFMEGDDNILYFFDIYGEYNYVDVSDPSITPPVTIIYSPFLESIDEMDMADYNGKLYLLNSYESKVIEYDPSTNAIKTYIDFANFFDLIDTRNPSTIAINSKGDMWVGCNGVSPGLACTHWLIFDSNKNLIDSTQDISGTRYVTFDPTTDIAYASGEAGYGIFTQHIMVPTYESLPPIWKITHTKTITPPVDIFFDDSNERFIVEYDFDTTQKCAVQLQWDTFYPGMNQTLRKEIAPFEYSFMVGDPVMLFPAREVVMDLAPFMNEDLEMVLPEPLRTIVPAMFAEQTLCDGTFEIPASIFPFGKGSGFLNFFVMDDYEEATNLNQKYSISISYLESFPLDLNFYCESDYTDLSVYVADYTFSKYTQDRGEKDGCRLAHLGIIEPP